MIEDDCNRAIGFRGITTALLLLEESLLAREVAEDMVWEHELSRQIMYDTSISGVNFSIDRIPSISPSSCHGAYSRWRQEVMIDDVRQNLKHPVCISFNMIGKT